MARPTKLTPATQERICQALRVGATYELAAQYGGVSYDAFNNWRLRGEAELARASKARTKTDIQESEAPYVEFLKATKDAEADAAIKWLAMIDKAAADSWQAAAWKLERRYPQDYGRTVVDQNLRGTGKDGAIPIVITKMNIDEL